MGTPITGREILVGLKKAATWDTAVACGAGDGLLLTACAIKPGWDMHEDDSLGQANLSTVDAGAQTVDFTLEGYLRYDGLDLLLAMVLGTSGTPAQQGASAAYATDLDLADSTAGLFTTLAQKIKSDVVQEIPGCKITGITIKGEMNAPLTFTADCIGSRAVYDSVTNTVATLASLTYEAHKDRVMLRLGSKIRINAQAGAALADSDALSITGFEFSIKRTMEGEQVYGLNGLNEPEQTAMTEVSLTLNFPKYSDDAHAFLAGLASVTEYKADLVCEGPIIADTYKYTFKPQFPRLIVTEAGPDISGAGKIPSTVTLKGLQAASAPTGMTGITKPVRISLINTQAASVLG